ncbi:U3 small nucleolar RNA-associated protein 14 homolog A [Eurytemora carolleeae]|uniref:U3 small nucleolar RNA-associated protein 14 homolog A n=1 Tax=Eurytemora carolleeae TaxID=1294199 RepID=UPI000C77E44B|nr:U3 small nucleolar RNA-associated protein 14 homolog A [Eurytemora carolleeae]|eukprot:XP_023335201.1 U3 small nucleolar RNA-associated protein 14 homolog A-like [Eurytemora affinis]
MFVERDLTDSKKREKKRKRASLNFSVSEVNTSQQKSPKKSAQPAKIPNNSTKKEKKRKKSTKPEEISAEVKDENDLNYLKLLLNNKDELDEFKDEDEIRDDNEDDEDERGQEDFVEAMSSLHGKKKKITTNRGSNLPLTDHSLPVSDRVNLSDLLNTLDSDTRALTRRTQGEKAELLSTPLEKPQAERITREAGYSRVREDVNVWDAVVHGRRLAENLTFPLINPDLRLQSADKVVQTRFSASTPLEQQVAAMLAGSNSVVQPGEDLSQAEKKALQGLTPREIAERKSELAKFRALQTYQEAKYRRQNKIKSKKYRKIARKEKNKEKLAELERLAETDPQAAAEELERIDRYARERMDLAKRAKMTKDKDLQALVQENLNKHRELLAKAKIVSESEDEDDSDLEDVNIDKSKLLIEDQEEESFADFSAGYKKFYAAEQNKKEVTGQEEMDDMFEDAEFSVKRKVREEMNRMDEEEKEDEEDEEKEETGLEHAESLNYPQKSSNGKLRPDKTVKVHKKDDVDPDDFLTVKTKNLKSGLPEIYGYNEEDEQDSDDEQRRMIAEAFAEDDVLADFQKEKAELVAASKPKDIDLTLPGWGEWGGGGLMPSKRKRRRFTIKAPPVEKRRDENRGNLIINVDKDEKIRAHKVSKVPYQFNAVSDFEASIRAPIGSTFLPRTAFLKLVKPKVVTKMGEVIQPMDRSHLLNRNIDIVS